MAAASGTRGAASARAGPPTGAVLFAAALGLAACADRAVVPSTHRIEIQSFRYLPASAAVRVGDTLVWRNEDVVPHTATAADGTWDTGSIGTREASRVVVERAGTHRYRCAFHPTMAAGITAR